MALIVRLGSGATSTDDIRALVETLVKAAGLPTDAPVLKDAVNALPRAISVAEGAATLDPKVILNFLLEQYDVDDDGKPGLRSVVRFLPSHWVFELNGGIPNVDFSQQKVVADMSVGYATKKVGLVGRGWIDTYTINDAQTHNDYMHAGGSLEGWWLTGDAADKLRVELRLAGAFDYYDTTTFPLKDPLNNYYDFDSRMGRGTGFVGVRYGTSTDPFSMQLLLGGGLQYEDPDTSHWTANKGYTLASDQNVTAQTSGRLVVRWHIVPRIVGVRLRGESTYFSITREELAAAISGSGGPLTTSSTVDREQQLELHGRMFVDADIASIAGFVPAVFGGIDYIGIQGTTTSTSTAIPLLGAGIVRNSW
jgi:hypothetical protein